MYMYVCMKNYKICLIVVENVCHDNDLYSTNIVFQYFKRRDTRCSHLVVAKESD